MTMSNSPSPGFIPTNEELNRLERDLRFHPSAVTHPRTLTAERIANVTPVTPHYLRSFRALNREVE